MSSRPGTPASGPTRRDGARRCDAGRMIIGRRRRGRRPPRHSAHPVCDAVACSAWQTGQICPTCRLSFLCSVQKNTVHTASSDGGTRGAQPSGQSGTGPGLRRHISHRMRSRRPRCSPSPCARASASRQYVAPRGVPVPDIRLNTRTGTHGATMHGCPLCSARGQPPLSSGPLVRSPSLHCDVQVHEQFRPVPYATKCTLPRRTLPCHFSCSKLPATSWSLPRSQRPPHGIRRSVLAGSAVVQGNTRITTGPRRSHGAID
jgi:hypothetical protein